MMEVFRSSSPLPIGSRFVLSVQNPDWSGYESLEIRLGNSSGHPASIECSLESAADKPEKKDCCVFRCHVLPGRGILWRVPLRHLYWSWSLDWNPQKGIREFTEKGWADTSALRECFLKADDGISVQSVRLTGGHPLKAWVDRFGQSRLVRWKGKTLSERDLMIADRREELVLTGNSRIKKSSMPGKTSPGRFFRVEEIEGRWWFVAPDGSLLWATGLDCINSNARAFPGTRHEAAYSWLPPKDEAEWPEVWTDRGFSFYRANLIRKWGKDYEEKARVRSLKRMQSWGFNTIGNWSDPELFSRKILPYVTMGPRGAGPEIPFAGLKLPDVFHPGFEASAFASAEKDLAPFRGDPWCIGHFVENEAGWSDLYSSVLGLSVDAPSRVKAEELLRQRYGTVEKLSTAWAVEVKWKKFDEVRWPDSFSSENARIEAEKDRSSFVAEFAEIWFRIWSAAVRKAAPGHLVLGCRFQQNNRPDEAVLACGRHMDVVSFNLYTCEPDRQVFDRYYGMTKKPFIVGEYGFNSLDCGHLTAAVPVRDRRQKGIGYRYYTENLAALPYFVGAHYFQYIDEPATGRFDRETSYNGFVDVCDRPWPELVAAARKTNPRLPAIHAGTLRPVQRLPSR